MSILECYLAAEKPKDGKPFTVCDVETWFYIGIGMLKGNLENFKNNAARLYNEFHSGKDKSERGVTLEELKQIPSNGEICIIPKAKDNFVRLKEWRS